jgi:hypothetical protein
VASFRAHPCRVMDKCCIVSLSQKPMTWERDYPVAGSALTEGGVATKRTCLRVTSSARCTDTSRGASIPIRTRPLANSKTTIVMLSPIVICSPAFRLSTSMIPSDSFEKTLTHVYSSGQRAVFNPRNSGFRNGQIPHCGAGGDFRKSQNRTFPDGILRLHYYRRWRDCLLSQSPLDFGTRSQPATCHPNFAKENSVDSQTTRHCHCCHLYNQRAPIGRRWPSWIREDFSANHQ